jgi:hypothetical protein
MLQSIIKGMVFVAVLAMAISCRPKTDFPEAGGDYNTPDAVKGNWKLQSVIQIDEGAVSKNFPDKAKFLDLTPMFAGTTNVRLAINGDSSFVLSNPDSSAAVMLPSGANMRWRLVDPTNLAGQLPINQARYLQIYRRDNGVEVESYKVNFGVSYRVAANKLALRVSRRTSDGTPYTSYDYNFVRN